MKITDEEFLRDLDKRVKDAAAVGDVGKIIDATLSVMERLATRIPQIEKEIRSAALEEAARVADAVWQIDLSAAIRALKDKPHE